MLPRKLQMTEGVDEKIKEAVQESLEELATVDEGSEEQHNEPSEVEVQARERGWRPLSEFDGDAETFVEAEEFVAREPLYKALHSANRKIKKMQETMDAFKEHHNKVEIKAKERALAELKEQLKVASEERDIGAALEIKDRITEISKETPPKEVSNTDFNTWVEKNQWYNNEPKLKTFATGIGFGLAQEHPEWTPAQVFEEVTKITKDQFPDKFSNPNKAKPNKVGSGNKAVNNDGNSKTKVPSFNQLPEDARKNYRKLVKSTSNPNGPLTHEEFLKEYIAVGGAVNNAE